MRVDPRQMTQDEAVVRIESLEHEVEGLERDGEEDAQACVLLQRRAEDAEGRLSALEVGRVVRWFSATAALAERASSAPDLWLAVIVAEGQIGKWLEPRLGPVESAYFAVGLGNWSEEEARESITEDKD